MRKNEVIFLRAYLADYPHIQGDPEAFTAEEIRRHPERIMQQTLNNFRDWFQGTNKKGKSFDKYPKSFGEIDEHARVKKISKRIGEHVFQKRRFRIRGRKFLGFVRFDRGVKRYRNEKGMFISVKRSG